MSADMLVVWRRWDVKSCRNSNKSLFEWEKGNKAYMQSERNVKKSGAPAAGDLVSSPPSLCRLYDATLV